MKLFILVFLVNCSLLAQAPKGFLKHTTEGLSHCESAVYDASLNRIYASMIGEREPGDGGVATVGLDGNIIDHDFITGLEDPKGIAITKDRLYVSDVTTLVEADRITGKILKRHTLDGIAFLNDVTIAEDGSIYVSDTRNSEIYKLDTQGVFTLWLKDTALDNPNGLLILNNTMYVVSWGGTEDGGAVSKVDMSTKLITPLTQKIGNLDGIRPYNDTHLIISDWRSGNIRLVDLESGRTQKIITVGISVGDIAYLPDSKTLLLPMNRQSSLLQYLIKE